MVSKNKYLLGQIFGKLWLCLVISRVIKSFACTEVDPFRNKKKTSKGLSEKWNVQKLEN